MTSPADEFLDAHEEGLGMTDPQAARETPNRYHEAFHEEHGEWCRPCPFERAARETPEGERPCTHPFDRLYRRNGHIICDACGHFDPRMDAEHVAARETPDYHEHVAGDKHAHAYNGPHSHGGVSTLAYTERCPSCGRSDEHAAPCKSFARLPGHVAAEPVAARETLRPDPLTPGLAERIAGAIADISEESAKSAEWLAARIMERLNDPDALPLRAATPDPAEPGEDKTPFVVRIRSGNCAAGDHGDCLGMVEQDTPTLGVTDCLCQCHATPDPAEPTIEATARKHYESQRHFFEPPDGDGVCSECGEDRDADFLRITVHLNDGDG